MLEINFLCIFTTIKRGIILNRIQLFGKDKNMKAYWGGLPGKCR